MKPLRLLGKILAWLFRFFILLMGFSYYSKDNITGFIFFLLTFILTLVPIMLEQLYKIKFHWLVELTISFLLAVHMFGFYGAYIWYPVYDDFAHAIGSAMAALIGFAFIYSLNYANRVKVSLPGMGVFTFLWTMALGAIWEIIEFTWDNITIFSYKYGFSQNSLLDTMTDLSLDALAGIVIALFCVFLVRRATKKSIDQVFSPFARMIEHKKPRG